MSSCPRCRRPIDETDCYCRHCGKDIHCLLQSGFLPLTCRLALFNHPVIFHD